MLSMNWVFIYLFIYVVLKILFYLLLERGEGKEKGRKTSLCGCLSHAPYWVPGLQPRQVPWLGIELATLWFTGQHPIHSATSARAEYVYLDFCISNFSFLSIISTTVE